MRMASASCLHVSPKAGCGLFVGPIARRLSAKTRKVLDMIWGKWEQKLFRKIRNKTRKPCKNRHDGPNHRTWRKRVIAVLDRETQSSQSASEQSRSCGVRDTRFRGYDR